MRRKRPGGPRYQPTDEQRQLVATLAAYGVIQREIAAVVGIDATTLARAFAHELDTAATKANAQVAKALFEHATKGKGASAVQAQRFWLACRAGWRSRDQQDSEGGFVPGAHGVLVVPLGVTPDDWISKQRAKVVATPKLTVEQDDDA